MWHQKSQQGFTSNVSALYRIFTQQPGGPSLSLIEGEGELDNSYIFTTFHSTWKFIFTFAFFFRPASSGIASCVGTVVTVMDDSWLGAALLIILRVGTAWGLSSQYNHLYGLYLETRLIGSRGGFAFGTLRSRGARSANWATVLRFSQLLAFNHFYKRLLG